MIKHHKAIAVSTFEKSTITLVTLIFRKSAARKISHLSEELK